MLISEARWHLSSFESQPYNVTITKLQYTHYIMKTHYICQPSYQGEITASPSKQSWSPLPFCNAQGPSSNTKTTLLRLKGLLSLTETLSAQPLPALAAHAQKTLLNSQHREPLLQFPSALSEACRARELPPLTAFLHACSAMASFLSLLFSFQKCISANTTGFLFQPGKKKWLFLPQCAHFPRGRNPWHLHTFASISIAVLLNRNISKSWRR